jgi:glycosyltransferase involved in cell wall biosynthesis
MPGLPAAFIISYRAGYGIALLLTFGAAPLCARGRTPPIEEESASMKVAFDLRPLQTESARRGIGTCVRRLLEQFVVYDAPELHFIAFRNEPAPHAGIASERLITVPRGGAGHLSHLLDPGPLEKNLAGRGIDIVHHTSLFEFRFGSLAGSRKLKTVGTIYDLIPLRFPKETFTGRRRLLFPLYKAALARAGALDRIITISEASRADLVDLCGLPHEKISAIPCGVDARFMSQQAETETFRSRLGLPERFVLYLGGFGFNKNIDGMLEAHRILTDNFGKKIPLVLAGPMDPYIERSIHKTIERLCLEGLVVLPGYVTEDDLPLLYRCALIFLFPSRYEGFGLPLLEAMACGVPVVTSRVSSMPEVVGDAALLVSPDAPGEIAEALSRLIEKDELRDTLAAKGVARARQFTWKRSAREHIALYEALFQG